MFGFECTFRNQLLPLKLLAVDNRRFDTAVGVLLAFGVLAVTVSQCSVSYRSLSPPISRIHRGREGRKR